MVLWFELKPEFYIRVIVRSSLRQVDPELCKLLLCHKIQVLGDENRKMLMAGLYNTNLSRSQKGYSFEYISRLATGLGLAERINI